MLGCRWAVEFGKKRAVIGFDVNHARIDELRRGNDHTLEISSEQLAEARHLSFTADSADLVVASIFIVTVPTPIDPSKRPDLSP